MKKLLNKIFSSQQLVTTIGTKEQHPFIQAISGCDTTSATFRKEKTTCFKLFKKHQDLHDIAEVFSNPNSTQTAVAEVGNIFFLRLYGAPLDETSLNNHRYHSF